MQAGGPGSGCRGSNCGRPRTKSVTTVPKRWAKQSVQTHSGIQYTILKASKRGQIKREKQNPLKEKHPQKGKFWRDSRFDMKTQQGDRTYFLKALKPGGRVGEGTTVQVTKRAGGRRDITEVRHGEFGHIWRTTHFRTNSDIKARELVKRKYGTRLP